MTIDAHHCHAQDVLTDELCGAPSVYMVHIWNMPGWVLPVCEADLARAIDELIARTGRAVIVRIIGLATPPAP